MSVLIRNSMLDNGMNMEEQLKKISVIIPVYNVEKYLEKCIDSVLAQTYKNIEIILVNDGSTDKSGAICDTYKSKKDNIIVIHQTNSGVSVARNNGLKKATGDYIAFVDPDDYILPEMYTLMVDALEKHQCDSVCSSYYLVGKTGKFSYKCVSRLCSGIDSVEFMLREDFYTTAVWNKLFKKECLYKDNNLILFPDGITVGEDQLWLYEVCSINNIKMYFFPEPLYNWVIRENSAIRKMDANIVPNDVCSLNVCDRMISYALDSNKKSFIRIAKYRKYSILLQILKDKYKKNDEQSQILYKELTELRVVGLGTIISRLQLKNLLHHVYWEIIMLLRKKV